MHVREFGVLANSGEESSMPQNVEIRNSTFRENGVKILFSGQKQDVGITIGGHSISTRPYMMRNIRIHNNTFINEGTCVRLSQSRDVWLWDNKIVNCGQYLAIDPETTTGIHRVANR